MELNDITTLARKLLDTTHHLFVGPNNPKSSFAKAVEGTFRRDHLTLSTMLILAEHDKPEVRIASVTDCMDLCRRVLEDFISLEYMLLEGKEAEAKKFFNYYHVEAKRDMDLVEAAGITIDQQIRKIRVENYDRVKGKFLDSSSKTKKKGWDELTDFLKSQDKLDQQLEQQIKEEFNRKHPNVKDQPRKAWAGLDTEDMIVKLVKGGIIDADEQRILIMTYLEGNKKNHFSPSDIHFFLDPNLYGSVNDDDLMLSLVVTTTCVTRMARIFTDEFDSSKDTKQAIEEIWQTIFTAHLSDEG